MSEIATEVGHWYDEEGTPRYTIIGKNGKERPTTLRDARTEKLFPSVTMVSKLLSAPGLDNWKIDQALMSALTLPRLENETTDEFMRRAKYDSSLQGKEAAEEGTRIHGAIERHLLCKPFDTKYLPHVNAVTTWLDTFNCDWEPEKSFCRDGYGGKCDLHNKDKGILIDFKGKDFGKDDKLKVYENHFIQLGAYNHGLNVNAVEAYICYVSRNNPGLIQPVLITQEDIKLGYEIFKRLLEIWRLKNNVEW